MYPGLSTATLSLSELLGPPFLFAVPIYQRPYSWTLTEARQLLEDLMAASGVTDEGAAEPGYFLGTMLLMDPGPQPFVFAEAPSEPRLFDIVDGQQHIVTLTILLAVLRDLEEDPASALARRLDAMIATGLPDGTGPRYRIALRGDAEGVLAETVQSPGACLHPADAEAAGPSALEARIVEIRDRFMRDLEALDDAARSRLADYIGAACHVVLMLTRDVDRAHRMFVVLNGRGKPLARNDILKAEIFESLPTGRAAWADAVWARTADQLGPDAFETLFGHIRAACGETRHQIIAGVRDIVGRAGGSVPFIETIFVPLSESYRTILSAAHEGSPQSAAIRRSLTQLRRLNGEEWAPAAMVALDRHRGDGGWLARQLEEIDRYAHVLRLLCLGAGKRATRFVPVVEALRAGADLSLPGGPTTLDRDDVRSIAYNMRDLHGRNPQACKIVLLRLNDILSGDLVDLEAADYSVEHILPQRPAPTSVWREWFPDATERESCTDSIGNMALLSKRQNDRARNQEFARKLEIYSEGKGEPLPAITRDILAAHEWRSAQIRAREARFVTMIERMWRIGLGERFGADGAAPQRAGRRHGRRGAHSS